MIVMILVIVLSNSHSNSYNTNTNNSNGTSNSAVAGVRGSHLYGATCLTHALRKHMVNTANLHTENCRTKNLWVNIPKLLRWEIRRCTKKVQLLRLRICLTRTPNLEIPSLKIGRNNSDDNNDDNNNSYYNNSYY